ncbi:ABC transporter permease [Catalinimonas niigatensis]|uniref:ABC transporter permease n=1 Tax=Catalinimonas niigatensis TaxID=1397264 RepID=UPI002665D74C|nr:ABC transporter permease [Catalinimonas niigatensis]WPP50207.1 FtsX-like permease family protein [Catalinimonas niigatensis]
MFKNYLLIALRNLLRNRTYTLINLLGLAIGISASLLMLMHIRQELSFENSFPKHKRISRASLHEWAKSSLPLAAELEKNFPTIEQTARLGQHRTFDVAMFEEKHIPVGKGYMADQEVIPMFDLEFVYGSKNDALTRPYTIVLTKSVAEKLFGEENPIGKSIQFGGMDDLEVTGVIENLPANTHLNFEYLISMPTQYDWLDEDSEESRGWMSVYTYVLFRDAQAMQEAEKEMQEFTYQFFKDRGATREELASEQAYYELHPISSIHLDGNREQEMGKNSDKVYVYIFSALALLIILIASVNFVNLFSTQVIKRSKEIGLRKVIGARRAHIFWQFLGEGLVVTLLAAALSLLLCMLLVPIYNDLAELSIQPLDLLRLDNLILLFVIVIVIVLMSSGAPSFAISGFSVMKAIKGNQLPSSWLMKSRKKLVVFQFAISIFIVISALVINGQMEYLQNKELGFDKEQLISVRLYGSLWDEAVNQREVFRNELNRIPGVVSIANTSGFLGNGLSVEGIRLVEEKDEGHEYSMRCIRADEGLIPTLELQLLQGRNFQPKADTSVVFIINENAADALNIEDPVGKMAESSTNGDKGEIIGVVKNFNYASLHYEVDPMFIEYRPTWVGTMLIKMEGSDPQQTVAQIEDKLNTMLPGTQMLYSFIDEEMQEMYLAENNMKKMLLMFSVLAIIIACLGLFGLTAYTVAQRSKEIGIRKVLGASLGSIVFLLSKDYLKLITLAFVVAVPVANYFLREWLQSFAYHIPMIWWMYTLPGVLVLIIALLAVSGQSLKAASANPVESLKDE